MVSLFLDAITVRYGRDPVVNALTLRVEEGESVALLGPSGSGKTTILRVAAGLEEPASGDVRFDGRRMNGISPAQRDLAMVFQDNVLFPTMDVAGNVGFPLKVRRVSGSEIAARVEAEARATRIASLLRRDPRQLSAGQQQVVQLARAMVRRPSLLLVDEPFARLDPVGTERMRAELRLVQRGYGVTALYATHDPADAVALADRVAVIDEGRVRQIGPPDQLYKRPADIFVATFVGVPAMALLRASAGRGRLTVAGFSLSVPRTVSGHVLLGVRPEHWVVRPDGVGARVVRSYTLGADNYALAEIADTTVTVRSREAPVDGEAVRLYPKTFHVFDFASGRSVYHSG